MGRRLRRYREQLASTIGVMLGATVFNAVAFSLAYHYDVVEFPPMILWKWVVAFMLSFLSGWFSTPLWIKYRIFHNSLFMFAPQHGFPVTMLWECLPIDGLGWTVAERRLGLEHWLKAKCVRRRSDELYVTYQFVHRGDATEFKLRFSDLIYK